MGKVGDYIPIATGRGYGDGEDGDYIPIATGRGYGDGEDGDYIPIATGRGYGDGESRRLYTYRYGKRVWRWGKSEIIYLSLRCHHQNDSCIKMGSDESHFNVS